MPTERDIGRASHLRRLVERRALGGASLDEIEAEVGRMVSDDERRAALWLYAWHCLDGRIVISGTPEPTAVG